MSNVSFKGMIKSGDIRRADAMKVRLEDIFEEEGFNLRDLEAVDPDGVSFQDGIDALAEYIGAGGIYPPLEVRPRAEGGVFLVDGHRRRLALLKLDAEGRLPRVDGEAWVSIVAFVGNDADRLARVITSQQGRRLNDLEKAQGCKRLAAFGWTPEQIGKAIGMTRQRVAQLLTLASANTDVQQMVKTGAVSGTVATELVRKHGEEAGKVLGAELDKAKAQGKTKVTGGTIKGPTVPRNLLDDLHAESTKLHQSLSHEDHATLEAFHRGSIDGGTIQVSVERLLHLSLVLEEAQRVLSERETKALEKANKARQMELAQQQLAELEANRG